MPDPPPRVPARSVNPHAGDYQITGDPAEQRAATAAAEQSWREFPYYERRYGERGRHFTLSDSGWLATLCDRPVPHALSKLRWLQELLIPRGMPSYLFERHLEILGAELVRHRPGGDARYDVVTQAAALLRDERTDVVPHATFLQLAAGFDASALHIPDRVANFGPVLMAGAIDESAGHADGFCAVERWACDPLRFSPAWVRAVCAATARMRAASRVAPKSARRLSRESR